MPVSPLGGALWGLVGAIAMVVVMQIRGTEAPPPFAVFWAKFLGDGDPEAAMPRSLLLHAANGIGGGLVFVLVFGAFDLGIPITEVTGGVLWGLVWALVLLVIAAVFWVNIVLDMDPPKSQVQTLVLAHLVYGLTLGILSAVVPL